jgi:hypothetical protein
MINLWQQGNTNLSHVSNVFAALADQMTSVIRQKGDNSTAPLAVGVTMATQTCIGVRWAWISFPATLLVLTTIFFSIVMARVLRSDVKNIWQSSSLALLFHGLNHDLSHGAAGDADASGSPSAEDRAKEVVMRLQWSGKDFEFVHASGTKPH